MCLRHSVTHLSSTYQSPLTPPVITDKHSKRIAKFLPHWAPSPHPPPHPTLRTTHQRQGMKGMGGWFNSLGNWVLEGNTHFWFWLCPLVYWRIKSVFCSLCHIPPCHSELLGKNSGFLEVVRSHVLPVSVTHWAGQSLGQLKGTLEKHQQQGMLFQICPVHSSAGAGWESLSWRMHLGFQSNPK